MSPINRHELSAKVGYKYNDTRRALPRHQYPAAAAISPVDFPGPFARILLEQALSSFEGIQLKDVERLGISQRDVARFRSQLRDAILSVLKEPPGANLDTIRNGAIAYVGALEIAEAFDVLVGMATNPREKADVRSLAISALRRMDATRARKTIQQALADPHAVVRKSAVRALGLIGDEEDRDSLKRLLEADEDPEVRRQINVVLQGPEAKPERPVRAKDLSQPIRDAVRRSLGRHQGPPPQTGPEHCGERDSHGAGGRDVVAEERHAAIERTRHFSATTYEVNKAREGRVHVIGELAQTNLCADGVYNVAPGEAVADLPSDRLVPGRPLPIEIKDCRFGALPLWVPDAPASPVIVAVESDSDPVWRGKEFGIRVRFRLPKDQSQALLRLNVKMPMSPWHSATFTVSDEEQAAGEKIVEGYTAVKSGEILVVAVLYGGSGGASRVEARLEALPTNPISMQIFPQTTGTNGEGPAHYNSSEDRFFCHVRAEVANGFPFSVTVGPTVTCRVTDGASHVATFSFNIGPTVIPANSVRNLFIFTSHGSSSDVYDVFEDFGDVRMDFTIQTTQGDITDWNVWAAMAQIRLALNFVGNISASSRNGFQSVVENEASAILEQQSLYITRADVFVLPSDNPDFNRFRDLIMDDNKDHDCTSGSDEADDLRDDWNSPTSFLDVWIVESLSGPACAASVLGFSPVDGPTDKDGDNSGFIIKINGTDLTSATGRQSLGLTIAHELGHFLGLEHVTDNTNFMNAFNMLTNTGVTHGQYTNMADHGFVERHVP
jgi:hypothetical protein